MNKKSFFVFYLSHHQEFTKKSFFSTPDDGLPISRNVE